MTKVIGHRGAARLAPENTLRSFRTALKYDVDAVEFDVRRTADDVLVVLHDATLDRTTDTTGHVRERTLDELASVDAGEGTAVPTVEEVLDLLAPTDVALQIELKGRAVHEELLPLLTKYGLLDRTVVTSFSGDTLEAVADAPTDRAYLTKSLGTDELERARSLGVECVCTHVEHASTALVQTAHDDGLRVGFWSVNTAQQIRHVLSVDADVLSTDRPDRVVRVLGKA